MAFDNETNRGRVQKILDLLGLIQKSAQTNRATHENLVEMLAPLTERFTSAGISTPAPPQAPTHATTRPPQWATVRQMAEEADHHDLTVGLAVYMNRVDEALSDIPPHDLA